MIGNFSDLPEVLRFVNSQDAEKLAHLGTELPRPLYPHQSAAAVRERGSRAPVLTG